MKNNETAATEEVEINPSSVKIPAFPVVGHDTSGWKPKDYDGCLLNGCEVEKLATSAIAPVIAAARGYFETDQENPEYAWEHMGLSAVNDKPQREYQLNKALRTGGAVLGMPWYSAVDVIDHAVSQREHKLEATSWQLRPNLPYIDKKTGKAQKYIFEPNAPTVLDIHPATPLSWINEAPTVLVAEGMLKGDSALTGLLRRFATKDELEEYFYDEIPASREYLSSLMERVPAEERVLIIQITSCHGGANKAAGWQKIPLSGRKVVIAMDADVSTKMGVWGGASHLTKDLLGMKAASVKLLDLPGDGSEGIDDILAKGEYNFTTLMLSQMDLPPRPEISRSVMAEVRAMPDMEQGVTYIVENVVNPDGSKDRVRKVIGQMAIAVDEVTARRSWMPGTPVLNTLTGRSSWVKATRDRDGYGVESVETATFTNVPLDLLSGSHTNVVNIQTTLSQGRGTGAYLPSARHRQILDAWRAESSFATRHTTELDTNGIFWDSDKDRLLWVTADGSFTSNSFDEDYFCRVQNRQAMQIPRISPVMHAKELIAAWEDFKVWGEVSADNFKALFPTIFGSALALSVGVAPKGATAIFGEAGGGKTTAVLGMSMIYGPEWGKRAGVVLEGTSDVAMKDIFTDFGNNEFVVIDDARKKDTVGETAAMKSAVASIIRASYSADAQRAVKVRDAVSGNWVIKQARKDSARVGFITGENIDVLGLKKSTVSRMMAWTRQGQEELFTAKVADIHERHMKNLAPSKVFGAWLTHSMRKVYGETEAQQRDSLARTVRDSAERRSEKVKSHKDCPPEYRDMELLAPIMGALDAFASMMRDAYRSVEDYEGLSEMNRMSDMWMDQILAAHRRHRETYADAAKKRDEFELLSALASAETIGKAALRYDLEDRFAIPMGRYVDVKDKETSEMKRWIFLEPNAVLSVMSSIGQRVSLADVKMSLDEVGVKSKQRIGRKGEVSPANGYLIPVSVWDEARGNFTDEEVDDFLTLTPEEQINDVKLAGTGSVMYLPGQKRDFTEGKSAA
jgi:hypothetical protein